jgi:hypothetical protein
MLAVLCSSLVVCAVASAAGPYTDIRRGGVIDQSYRYHQRIEPTSARAGGWYGWGFPVETYSWGWFGVEHYYPTVLWHYGYNGESVRWAYRQGY